MQVSVESTSNIGRKLTIEVPAAEVDPKVDKKLEDAKKSIRIDGFRPGKVPLKVIRQRYGDGVRHEVLADVMRDAYLEAISEQKLEPAGLPGFEAITNEAGKDLAFTASFEVYPEITLGDFSTIEVEQLNADIGASDIDEMVEKLREQRANWTETDTAAKLGDKVTINFAGRKEGELFDGGSADDQELELGSGQMIPGFEDGIVGHGKGEEFVLPLTFPEDYQAEELKGQAVEFTITLTQVQTKQLPEVDADFMKTFGVEDGDKDAFLAKVKENMTRELKNALDSKTKQQIMDGLAKLHDFELPSALVDNEVSRMRQQMAQQFGGGQQFDASMLPAELFQDQAQRSVKLGLVVRDIISSNNIEAEDEAIVARIEDIASQYDDADEVKRYFLDNAQQKQQIEGLVLEQKVVDKVLESAKVTQKNVPFSEAVAPLEESEES